MISEVAVNLASPVASRSSVLLARAAEASMRLDRKVAWGLTLWAWAATIALDRWSGPQINLVFLYMIVACFASWCLGERPGLGIALTSVAAMGIINGFAAAFPGQGHSLALLPTIWNTAGRALTFTMLVLLASGLRHTLDQVSWRASVDPLTGALNRGAFSRSMAGMISLAQRRGSGLMIAYIDLDGFKGVNDVHGHAAGDVVLSRFAAAAGQAIRASDLFARVGGDEFALLIGLDQCAQGDVVAERLHSNLSEALKRTGYLVTCSMGALVLEGRQVTTTSSLIEAADGLMYEVKRSGKNALRVARGDLQPVTLASSGGSSPSRRSAA
jgi:diguanylate cyclase (GGDEF)-like protein